MYTRYIIMIPFWWAGGETLEEAEKKLEEISGRSADKPRAVWKFTSDDEPFGGIEDDTHAYVDGFGAICWKGCKCKQIEEFVSNEIPRLEWNKRRCDI